MAPPFLSVIIPAFNEADRIIPTLEKINIFINEQKYAMEVIVVDDCSTDDTERVVSHYIAGRASFRLMRHTKNIGKGGAVRTGMLVAKGEFRLFSDADLSTPIEEVNTFFPYVRPAPPRPPGAESYDVVIGSRRVDGARIEVRQPIFREFSGRVFSVLVRCLILPGFIDTQCGFKLFSAVAAQEIFSRLTILDFGFDVEVLYLALRALGMKVKEAPVRWRDSAPTKVRFFTDSVRMFWDLIKIRRNNLDGKYR